MTESLAPAEPRPAARKHAAVALQRSAFVSFTIWFPPSATMQDSSRRRTRVRKIPPYPDESVKTIICGLAARHTPRHLLWRRSVSPFRGFRGSRRRLAPQREGVQEADDDG